MEWLYMYWEFLCIFRSPFSSILTIIISVISGRKMFSASQDSGLILIIISHAGLQEHLSKSSSPFNMFASDSEKRTHENVIEYDLPICNSHFYGETIRARKLKFKTIWFLYRGLDQDLTCAVIHDDYSEGLGEADQQYRLMLYGENSIDIKVKSYARLFFEEVCKKVCIPNT